jgi:hypothetical protein
MVIEMERLPDEADAPSSAVAVAVRDLRDHSLLVEIGCDVNGVYATVTAFVGDDRVEARIFGGTDSTLIVVDDEGR